MSNYEKTIRFPLRPRIRITSFCNRKCNYCFAQDFIHSKHSEREISLKRMEHILQLCSSEGITMVGWQGGEPILHTKLNNIIELHRKYNIEVMLFSNGLYPTETINKLQGVVKQVLLNCNEPDTYSVEEWNLLNSNIQEYIKVLGKENVALGINIYEDTMNTDFIIDLAKRYKAIEVRLDMTRPAPSHENDYVSFDNITKMFNKVKETIIKLREAGIEKPHFDCPFPLCKLSQENRKFLERYMFDDGKVAQCRTSLDIECSGMLSSCYCSIPLDHIELDDFQTIWYAWLSIEHVENKLRWDGIAIDDCKECSYHSDKICQGGCLGYKVEPSQSLTYEELISEQQDLPTKYLSQLAQAYKLFYTKEYKDCYILLKELLNEYTHERTLWLMVLTCLYVNNDEVSIYMVQFIKKCNNKLFDVCDAITVLYEADMLNLARTLLIDSLDNSSNREIGYLQAVKKLISISKKQKNMKGIGKYLSGVELRNIL